VSISAFELRNITMIRTAIVAASLALLTSTSFAQYYGGYRPSYGYSTYHPSYSYTYGYSRYGYGRRW
jgi:hypothetical protein